MIGRSHLIRSTTASAALIAALFLVSCTELKRPEPNPYLAETQPPRQQEFRWSNGRAPKSVDPARAAAAPETDVVRAVYEGLTEVDPTTLEAIPGVAEKWSSSDDNKVWTFELRKDAKWSNGKQLIAADFVRSWQRLLDLGEKTAHRNLLDNIARISVAAEPQQQTEPEDFETVPDTVKSENETAVNVETHEPVEQTPEPPNAPSESNAKLDVVAENDYSLIVKLDQPDSDLPKLVSHPIFRPVFGSRTNTVDPKLDQKLISNGAFKIDKFVDGSLELERSKTYWNFQTVKLDRVVFVPVAKTDDALEAYRNGRVDAVTNAEFTPLAQKVFSPYADFQRSVFGALNFYEINYTKPPFSDRRIRQALSISIERERLSEAELEGTTQPAFSFLPFASASQVKLVQDKERARELFEQAGFAGGRGFPMIRLVVNRNETQQRLAREVMRMWKDVLNVETHLVVKENNEIAETRASLDFDVLRRGIVFPVSDEFVCITSIHSSSPLIETDAEGTPLTMPTATPVIDRPSSTSNTVLKAETQSGRHVLPAIPVSSEEMAMFEMRAIPLYFPVSFALVKPYVLGFEMNSLEVQSLGTISIDSNWQPR